MGSLEYLTMHIASHVYAETVQKTFINIKNVHF